MFSRTNTRKYAEQRMVRAVAFDMFFADMFAQENIDEYCKALIKLPSKISQCEQVLAVCHRQFTVLGLRFTDLM